MERPGPVLDIATGFFEIGALLALDGDWQKLEKIRLLMGDEVSLRTKTVFTEALRKRVGRLNDSLEQEKGPNPFLEGVEAVVEAIAEGRILSGPLILASDLPTPTPANRKPPKP